MNLLFIHDHHFFYDKETNNYYDASGGAFGRKLWERYLSFSNHITVVGRQMNEVPNNLVLSSEDNVTFSLIDDIRSHKDHFLKRKNIREKIKKNIDSVDFVIIRVPSTLGYIAQSICREIQKPYLLEVVGCPWDTYMNYNKFTKIIAPYAWFQLRKSVSLSNATIYVTKRFLQKRYPTSRNSIAISNVNIEETISKSKASNFYIEYNPSDIFKIAYIGTFQTKYKGHDILLKALKDVIAQNSIKNIMLYLVGTGDHLWVEQLIKKEGLQNHVTIVGTLESGENGIIPFLDSIHLYVHPSLTEGLPRVVLEAMSRGRLALGSRAGGIPELLNDNFTHNPGDIKKLTADIISIYKHRINWTDISENNIQVSENYLEVNLQKARRDFYLKIINNE